MKLCTLCHWLLEKRRWLLLPAAMALALALSFVLPTPLWLLMCAAVTLPAGLTILYTWRMHGLVLTGNSRPVAPQDAQAEIVAVDASLLDQGMQLQAAAQPFEIVPEMSLRMGGGALLLGTAMALLADRLPDRERRAVLKGAEALNLRSAALKQQYPAVYQGTEDGMDCISVQDGNQERSYFMGDADTVASCCSSIWDGSLRLMGEADRRRILESAGQMKMGGRRVIAYATAAGNEKPAFLGLITLGNVLNLQAVFEMNKLRDMGLTLMLRDDGAAPLDIAALRSTLELPDLHARPDICLCAGEPYPDQHCLSILMEKERPLSGPLRLLREHYSFMTRLLCGVFRTGSAIFLCCILAGGSASVLLSAIVLAAAVTTFGDSGEAAPLRWYSAAFAAACCLPVRLLLNAAAPPAADAAGSCLCTLLAALLSLSLAPRPRQLTPMALLPLAVSTLGSLLPLLTALPQTLLPGAFVIVCALLIGLSTLLIHWRRT